MLDKQQLSQIEHLIKKVGNFQIQNQSRVILKMSKLKEQVAFI